MFKNILVACLLVMFTNLSFARYATITDAPVEILQRDLNFTVHKDGTFDIDVVKRLKILNERGREGNSKISLYYNHDNSKVTIIEAKTIIDGKEYKLTDNLIEDKPLASEIQGFDQTNQVLLAFPNVTVGAEIYIHYKLQVLNADIPNFFEYWVDFAEYYSKESNIHVKSELPLYINKNDPDNYLKIVQSKDKKLYTLDIKLQKPIYICIVDEKHNQLNPKKYPWVFMSSSNSWDAYATKMSKDYLAVQSQQLPLMYQEIVKEVKKEPDPIKQIALVSALLNDHIQYMGDWKTSNGRHIPQNLQDVTNKRLGDCKDFATAMVAILKGLNIKAQVALVQRGHGVYDKSYITLPGSIHFNHAMVRVELAQDKVLWVDPTNFISIANIVLPDIADRQALVLDKEPYLAQIPRSKITDNVMQVTKTIDLSDPYLAKVHCDVNMQGLAAIMLTGASLQASQDSIDNAIVAELGNFDNIIEKHVKTPKLDSRLVQDLNFEVDYVERNLLLKTNAGQAVFINDLAGDRFRFGNEQVADIYLGSTKITKETIILNNIQVSNTKSLDYTIKSPWIDIVRTVKYNKNNVTIEQEVTFKTNWLYNEIIKSKEYQDFLNEVTKNFKDGIAIVF